MSSLRLVTFDVTGTLLKFRKPPVQQYLEIGAKHGVTADEERMKVAFKEQWKELNEKKPNFGTCWRSWWTEFVVNTFRNSDARGSVTEGTLGTIATELIEHFTTTKCWEVKEGAVELLLAVKQLESSPIIIRNTTIRAATAGTGDYVEQSEVENNSGKKLKSVGVCTSQEDRRRKAAMQIGVVSNFDSRLEQILRATQLHHFFDFFILSHECKVSKPHQGIFSAALSAATKNQPNCPPLQPAQALHIGDSFALDFQGAVNAGWNSILVIPPDQQKDLPSNIRNANPPLVFPSLVQLKSHLLTEQELKA